MKKLLILSILSLLLLLFSLSLFSQSIGIGTATPNVSAQLDISSTTKGVLVPRMTTAERIAIATPAKGLLVFDNTSSSFWFHNGTVWAELNTGVAGWGTSGNGSVVDGTNFIGTTTNVPLSFRQNNIAIGRLDAGKNNVFLGDLAGVGSISAKEKIVYSGFEAQQVENAAKAAGYNFSGVIKPQNDKDHYNIVYSDFVPSLVKSVQELSVQNEQLRTEMTELKKLVKEILKK